MNAQITIEIPEEIRSHSRILRLFFDSMIQKLYQNRHKDALGADYGSYVEALDEEMGELFETLWESEPMARILDETADVANCAYLLVQQVAGVTSRDHKLNCAAFRRKEKDATDTMGKVLRKIAIDKAKEVTK